MAGMYVAVGLASLGISLTLGMFGIYWVAIPTMFIMAAVGVAFYLLLLDRAARFGESPQILLTIGLSIGAQGLAQVLRGSGFKLVPNPINGAAIRFGGLNLQVGPTISFIVAIAVTIMMAWVLRATRFGKSARAVAESVETAEMLGIDARRVYIVSTSIAIGLVGLAAALLIPYHYTFPNVGQNFVVVAFLAIVIAGLGNVVGAVFGGLLMGIMQSLTASYSRPRSFDRRDLRALPRRPAAAAAGSVHARKAHAVRRALVILMAWTAAAAAGLLLKNNYFVSVATAMAFLALWAQSWNLLCGLTGNISLGHSVFVAVAAYVTVLLFQTSGCLAARGRPSRDSWRP